MSGLLFIWSNACFNHPFLRSVLFGCGARMLMQKFTSALFYLQMQRVLGTLRARLPAAHKFPKRFRK